MEVIHAVNYEIQRCEKTLITSAINACSFTYFRMLIGYQFTKQKKELATEILVVLHFFEVSNTEIFD